MSDTPNPAAPASNWAPGDDFAARLKRTDEARWLASRYAPQADAERLTAIYLLHQELQRALQAREPMLAKIRIQWWRETLEGLQRGEVRRHDLNQELARVGQGRADLVVAMLALVDAFDDVADDHLQDGGHDAGQAHAVKHMAAGAALMRLAGLALVDASAAELAALDRIGAAQVARLGGLSDAGARWTEARVAARGLRSALWPALAHLAVDADDGPLAMRWKVFRAVLMRRV